MCSEGPLASLRELAAQLSSVPVRPRISAGLSQWLWPVVTTLASAIPGFGLDMLLPPPAAAVAQGMVIGSSSVMLSA